MTDSKKYKISNVAKEGNVLNITNDRITIDPESTEKRKKEIEELTNDMCN